MRPRALTTERTCQGKTRHFPDLVPKPRCPSPPFLHSQHQRVPHTAPKALGCRRCPNRWPCPQGFQFIPKGEPPRVREAPVSPELRAPGSQPRRRPGKDGRTSGSAAAQPRAHVAPAAPRAAPVGGGQRRHPETAELAGDPGTLAPPPGRRRVLHPAECPSRADDAHRARRTHTARRTRARTHAHATPRSHDGACREREGARPSPARPAFPLLRSLCSRHLRPSAPASRLRPRSSRQRGSRPRSCLFKWWGQRAAPAAAAWVAPRAAIEGRTKMAAALAL